MTVFRFGPFELDARCGELRRGAYRVRLRPQPCAALTYLIEHAGEFVSRGELQGLIWPPGTFVHFDQGLNSCIKQIRAALGDDPRRPRYIETFCRRGYRFIMEVEISNH